ncbi:uncharacterized protein K02A2.6-like [Cydia pomonella]|uniref:uncharacterized protein K02A2.6-like n=1 Tax=Cydia pomonella TaxID=82600 RepID=UPI002ADE147F|nr:uncharacterized protein K02A2.6-like [Cydia pomonella]
MSVGKISEFKIHTDDWRLYIERLEQYFLVNKIVDDLKVPTLITVMGAESYELLVSLCTPTKPSEKTFKDLTAIMERHLQPKPSALAERYKFRHRKQATNESIAEYVAILKRMSKTCEFGLWLEESLRDQLVCGLSSEMIRQRLFAEENLDFAKAYSLAVSLAAAEKDAAVVEGSCKKQAEVKVADCQAMAGAWQRNASVATGDRAQASSGQSGVNRQFGQRAHFSTRGQQTNGQRTGAAARQPAAAGQRGQRQCSVCGGSHPEAPAQCKFARYVCRVCNREGHLQRVCPNVTGHHRVEAMTDMDTDDSDEVIVVSMNHLSVSDCKPIMIPINVHNKSLSMELDTGCAVSCISLELYQREFADLELNKSNVVLRYYTGELVKPLGVIKQLVNYRDRKSYLNLYVIKDGITLLLGRQWIAALNILDLPGYDEYMLGYVNSEDEGFNITEFSSRFSKVFEDGLGRFTGGQVSIHLRPEAQPVFLRARPLAYALREPVERALEQLVRDGVLTPVDRSDWATPIVPVVKKDGNIRICADYKLTINKVLEVDRYPLPRVEDLLVRLDGGDRFSKIDLSQAYAQFELDESKKVTVINTHKGLFMYNRLVYGLSSSPGIFQRRLEQLFADLPHVGVFLDDIIITGTDTRSHIENLHKVFDRLQSFGLRVKKEKCAFFQKTVNYLGHVISKDGVQTCPDKITAIINTPTPTNITELRAFIGLVMYYSKFVANVSTILAPLYMLLRAGVRFEWNDECQVAFDRVKSALCSSKVLVHYSVSLPLVLTSDASSVGVAAVISHLTAEGERPIAYASRALTTAERAYAQIDREALGIIFGIRKFHQYLYGRKFILRTDHKPLTHIFGNKVGIPVMAASRIQRWAVLLSGYDYEIEYVASAKNCADALSRLPQTGRDHQASSEVTYVNFVEDFLPVTNEDVKKTTEKDILLTRIMSYVQSGWPTGQLEENLNPFYVRRNEMYIDRGCLMWGYRMIIPCDLREIILQQLHTSHMGIVKTKALARSYVWWPGIDADVEALCRRCDTCAAEAPAPARAQPSPWPYPPRVWSRLHCDFLGPFKSKVFFVLVDAGSKWIEIFEMSRTNALSVIKVLRETFARFGLPAEIVSDQGPPFTSVEFGDFLKRNGIRQYFSPIYHQSSNGAAEAAVKLCKRALKKAYRDKVDVEAALQTYLMAYRNSAQSTTGESPAMLLMRHTLRTRLDLLRGDGIVEQRVHNAQERQVRAAGGATRAVARGDPVWSRSYTGQDKWVKGTVVDKTGSNRYIVDNGQGGFIHRHIDQIRRRTRFSNITWPNTNEGRDQSHQMHEGAVAAVGGGEDVSPVVGVVSDDGAREVGSEEVVGQAISSPEQIAINPSPTISHHSTPPPPVQQPMVLRPLPHRIRGIRQLEID